MSKNKLRSSGKHRRCDFANEMARVSCNVYVYSSSSFSGRILLTSADSTL